MYVDQGRSDRGARSPCLVRALFDPHGALHREAVAPAAFPVAGGCVMNCGRASGGRLSLDLGAQNLPAGFEVTGRSGGVGVAVADPAFLASIAGSVGRLKSRRPRGLETRRVASYFLWR